MKPSPALSLERRQVLKWGLCGMCAPAMAQVPLPPPSDAIILRWDRLGAVAVAGATAQPVLLLHADGRYSVPSRTLGGARVTHRLSPAELQALLTDILVRHRFTDLKSDAIEAQIRAQAPAGVPLLRLRDGGVTRLEVLLPDWRHTVELANAHAAYQQFPQIDALQRLHAIQQRLLALVEPPSVR
jgi:hypothetical protein